MDNEKKESIAKTEKNLAERMKPYLVYDYLMRVTDMNHTKSATDIKKYLCGLGIDGKRRSVYKDIEAINRAVLLTTRDVYGVSKASTVNHAEKLIQNEKEKTIVYDASKKGFYVQKRHYKVADIRFLAECIYATKFIDQSRAERLVHIVCDLVSENYAEEIERDVFLPDRVKTENTSVYELVRTISRAMSKTRNRQPHVPEKIKFKYMSYAIQNGVKRTERRKGEWYVVSPYKLLINDGNYYLIGYDDKMNKIVNYRVDRIKDLELTGDPRNGAKQYEELNIESYLQEQFSMYHGKHCRIQIRALNMLLDTFIDRFGTHDVLYTKYDDKHFIAAVNVSVSPQFYGWLCGFGNKVKILSPSPIVEEFKKHLDKMRGMYE